MSRISRRQFVKTSTTLGAAATIGFPGIVRARGLNEKLQVGFVAVGGRAGAHTKASYEEGCQCVAFAEVDKTRWGGCSGSGRLGRGERVHGLAQNLRQSRQRTGRCFCRYARPQPLRPFHDGNIDGDPLLYRETHGLVRA